VMLDRANSDCERAACRREYGAEDRVALRECQRASRLAAPRCVGQERGVEIEQVSANIIDVFLK
jgi:hypothetical protein